MQTHLIKLYLNIKRALDIMSVIKAFLIIGFLSLHSLALAESKDVLNDFDAASEEPNEEEPIYDESKGDENCTVDGQYRMQCFLTKLEELYEKLDEVYPKALAALPNDKKIKLQKSQQAWLTFVNLDCDAYFGADTGFYAKIWCAMTKIRQFQQRIERLEKLIQQTR